MKPVEGGVMVWVSIRSKGGAKIHKVNGAASNKYYIKIMDYCALSLITIIFMAKQFSNKRILPVIQKKNRMIKKIFKFY